MKRSLDPVNENNNVHEKEECRAPGFIEYHAGIGKVVRFPLIFFFHGLSLLASRPKKYTFTNRVSRDGALVAYHDSSVLSETSPLVIGKFFYKETSYATEKEVLDQRIGGKNANVMGGFLRWYDPSIGCA